MKKTLLIIALVTASVTIFSCKKETPQPEQLNAETNKVDIDNCVGTEVVLKAGQTINAGTITVTNDAGYIYITYTTANGYLLTQTHLFAGNCALVPVNNSGNPMPGQFPYKTIHNYATSYTYQIPVGTVGLGNCGCIAAHAVVVKLGANGQIAEQQTGWGNGVRINPNGGNWGMKFDYCTCTFTP